MFNQDPTPELIAWFEHKQAAASANLGPTWLEGDPLQRVPVCEINPLTKPIILKMFRLPVEDW